MNEAMLWKWVRFVFGGILFSGMTFAVLVYDKQLNVMIHAAPLGLMGFDIADLVKAYVGGKK